MTALAALRVVEAALAGKAQLEDREVGREAAHLAADRQILGLVGEALEGLFGLQLGGLVPVADQIGDGAIVEFQILVEGAQAPGEALRCDGPIPGLPRSCGPS